MGKKKGTSSLGKGIIKDRSKSSKSSKVHDTWLHTSELNDGYDWNRINLKSVTEQSNLEDFLETAELAGTEFTAERLNVKVIDPGQHTGLPSATESIEITKAQRENIAFLQIPRRPKWDSTTSAEQLNQMEKEAFLDWRRQLSVLQEKDHIVLTPFERNLDFWRQLWRVIERSDVIVQIVDARNPLLFRCLDLEKYVKEVSSDKENIILISKADLLTQAQREKWAEYFSQQGIRVAFWSAVRETERIEEKEAKEDDAAMEDDEDNSEEEEEEEEEDGDEDDIEDEDDEASRRLAPDDHLPSSMEGMVVSSENAEELPNTQSDESGDLRSNEASLSGVSLDTMSNLSRNSATEGTNSRKEDNSQFNQAHGVSSSMDMAEASARDAASSKGIHDDHMDDEDVDDRHTDNLSRTTNAVLSGAGDGLHVEASCAPSQMEGTVHNASHLLTGEELLGFFREVHGGRSKVNEKMLTVGMVGYPNVGKSSTINALLREKKVPVSATPGRTKHFQTLFVEPTLCLCDCPGLVMPSFVSTKADMYLNGILPIDQMRDFTPPVSLMCQRVPREVLELTYGMNLIKPREGEDPDRPPTALEFLNAHAYVRGFMTQKGVPDSFRSARIVLKDYVSGKVLFRIPPPGVTPEEFDSIHYPTSEVGEVKAGSRPLKSANKPMITEGGQTVKKSAAKKVDESFFAKPSVAHTKALPPRIGVVGGQAGPMDGVGFMGKPWKKQKRGKKEKLRKVYGHLDEK